jgi:hypothetical protein
MQKAIAYFDREINFTDDPLYMADKARHLEGFLVFSEQPSFPEWKKKAQQMQLR